MRAMLRASSAGPDNEPMLPAPAHLTDVSICQACGACCAYSRDWPRFTTETEAEIARVPAELVDDDLARIRCHGDRCSALVGEVGVSTSCAIYSVRPDVCRACEPGDEACAMARQRFGLGFS
jgi:uncharacterized protein